MSEISEKRPLVLIIDDDEVNRRVLEVLFRHESIEYMSAETGEEGLNLAQKRIPDLILLDLVMPNENGLEILQQFKRHPNLSAVPVIIFTIIEREETRQKAFELGADDYLTKPFDMRGIIEEIHKRLKRR
jgi:DNA-binding response OmpR family regulator